MWNHKELNQADCSSNGEVTSIVYFKSYIFSGHSDGTLKVVISEFPYCKSKHKFQFMMSEFIQVWEGSENILRLVQESQEHTKAITSLSILPSEEKLYSGSLDRTIRVHIICLLAR
jgi:WD40 repeat protein